MFGLALESSILTVSELSPTFSIMSSMYSEGSVADGSCHGMPDGRRARVSPNLP
jgi:hypothetical protein